MYGVGFVNAGGLHHHFVFRVAQVLNQDYARLEYWVNDPRWRGWDEDDDLDHDPSFNGGHDRDFGRSHRNSSNHFEATSIDSVIFSDSLAFRPARGSRPAVDTVRFRGAGKWNGRPGYTFEASATDQGEPGRHRDTFSLVINDSHGNIVGGVSGSLDGGNIQSSVVAGNPNPPPPATPTLVQHVSTASNEWARAGNPFFISLPNTTGAGNTLILGISYPFVAGRTVAIHDDKGNIWTLGSTTPSSPSDGQMVSSLYYASGVVAGTQKIAVTFDVELFNFQAVLSEFYNVATVTAADGHGGSETSGAPTVTTGGFTTSTAGDLIYSYAFNTNNRNAATNFQAGSGFTLLSADLQLGSVAQYAVQPSAGSIDPAVTVTGGADPFNAVGLALKASAAGTPPAPGIRIVHVYHVLYRSTAALQFPSSGNLLLCMTSFGAGNTNVSAMSTSPGNTWTKAPSPQPLFEAQIWYAPNATTSPNLLVTPTTSSPYVTLVFYDVTGAAASPYDATAGVPDLEQYNVNNANLLDMPILTPSTTQGLVFAVLTNGYGPTIGIVGQGFTLDSITYGNQIDYDAIENADGYAHYYNSTTAPVSFGWIMNSSILPEDSIAVAIAFKGA